MALPAIAWGVAAAIGAFWGKTRVQNYLDPTDPGKFEGRMRQLSEVLRDRENASDWSGNDGIVASRLVQELEPTVKLDLIRSGMEPEVLRETLRRLQSARVDRHRESPEDLGFATILAAPFREKSLLGSLDVFADAPARVVDQGLSRLEGEATTLGNFVADRTPGAGVIDTIVSGTIDAGKVMFADPLIIGGKVGKVARLLRTPGQRVARWFGEDAVTKLDDLIDQPRTWRWAEQVAGMKSTTRIMDWARVGGAQIEPGFAKVLSELDNPEDIIKAFRESPGVGYKTVPRAPFLGKQRLDGRALVKRMPLLRPFQRVWETKLSLYHEDLADDLIRVGDFFYGATEKGGKEATGLVRDAVDKVLRAEGRDRVTAIEGFWEDSISAFAHRKGVPEEFAREALKKMREDGKLSFTQESFGGALISAPERPLLETQTAYTVTVPSYWDAVRLDAEFSGIAKKHGLKSLMKADDFVNALEAPIRRYWLANPASQARNLIEEMTALSSDPEIQKFYVRALKDRMLGWLPKALAPGRVYDDGGKLALVTGDADEAAWLAERAEKVSLPDRARAKRAIEKQAKFDGPIHPDARKEIGKEGPWDGHVWTYLKRTDSGYTPALHHVINKQILGDRVSQMLLAYWDEPDEIKSVIDLWSKTPEGAAYLRLLPEGDIAQAVADNRALIEKIIPPSLMDEARTGSVSFESLKEARDLPALTYGPGLVNDMENSTQLLGKWQQGGRITHKIFGVAGGVMDNIARGQAFDAFYPAELKRITDLAGEAGAIGKTVSLDEIEQQAFTNTVRKVLANVDHPGNRTRFDYWAKTWIPFVDAQMRFWKRWGKRAIDNPAYVEKRRLLLDAGLDIGFLDEDDRGNISVAMPLTAPLAAKLLGAPRALVDDVPFTIDRKAEGGLQELGKSIIPAAMPFGVDVLPGFGPVMKMTVGTIAKNRPSLEWLEGAIFGKGGIARKGDIDPNEPLESEIIGGVMVGWHSALWRFIAHRDRDVVFASSFKDALAVQAYLGNDISDEKVQDKARNQARSLFLVKGLMQFFSPYTPSAMPFGRQVADDWREMRTKYGPEVGTVRFLEKWGDDAFAFTVPKSRAAGGAALAISAESERFHKANPKFFKDHPLVAGYFTRDLEGEYDPEVSRKQTRRGQREYMEPQEWIADAMYRLGNKAYYETIRPQYESFIAQGADKRAAQDWLENKRLEIDQKYPGWMQTWAGWSARQNKRDASVRALIEAVDEDAVRDTPTAKASMEWLDTYARVLSEVNRRGYQTLKSNDLAGVRAALAQEARGIMGRYKSRGFEAIYQYMFQNELEEYD